MSEESVEEGVEEEAPLPGVGDRLRQAREKAGLEIEDVASETRISARHLTELENGNLDALPGRTYAVGFAKNFARAVGLDEEEIAESVRAELDAGYEDHGPAPAKFEPGDPARTPSSGLAWLSGIAILLLLVGGYFFFRPSFAPGGDLPPIADDSEQPETPEQPRQGIDPDGAVVFTALADGIWVKFYDANETQLMQKQMALGETYTVPADANGPQLWTGRPDALRITIGGRELPRLAEDDQVMRDIPVTAEALIARLQPQTAPSPAATATPAASPTATPTRAAPRPAPTRAAPRPTPSPAAPTPQPTATQQPTPTPTATAQPTPAPTSAQTPASSPAPAASEGGDGEE